MGNFGEQNGAATERKLALKKADKNNMQKSIEFKIISP